MAVKYLQIGKSALKAGKREEFVKDSNGCGVKEAEVLSSPLGRMILKRSSYPPHEISS